MKEGLVILLVIVALLALTAFRYRKHITSLIGIARMLKEVKDQAGRPKAVAAEHPGVQLVHCVKCGVWFPQDRAVARNGEFYCSRECSLAKVT